jgi:hypothetical protein
VVASYAQRLWLSSTQGHSDLFLLFGGPDTLAGPWPYWSVAAAIALMPEAR